MNCSRLLLLWLLIVKLVAKSCTIHPLLINQSVISLKHQQQHLAALILARGGSKGIPLKNLAQIKGRTLLNRTLSTVYKLFNEFDSIWVSTDHDLIVDEATKVDGVNVHLRSADTADDQATSVLAVQEFLAKHPEIDIVALIQCTSPFLKSSYLQRAIELIKSNGNCVFSVTRSFKLRWTDSSGTDNNLTPLNFDVKHRPRRQDWHGELIENGMFYIATRAMIRDGYFQNRRQVSTLSISSMQ